MKEIEKVEKFLKEAGVYYLATTVDNKPYVRTFGTINLIEGKLYIQTGRVKDVYKQIYENNNAEICAFNNGKWIRVSGKLKEDPRREAKADMLDKYPELKNMYSADNDNTVVLYFENGKATIYSFTAQPEVIEF